MESPISGIRTSEVRRGSPSTSRAAKLRSESGSSIWEWTGGVLADMEVRPSLTISGVCGLKS
jgi:hypothetical protein